MAVDPFHSGERDAQRRAGVQLRGAPIREEMPDQHRLFFAGLPILFVGVPDAAGWPVATVLAGPPGFVSSADAHTLHVGALPGQGDPAAEGVRTGASAGMLGIDLGTRRRNRVNGTILAMNGPGFTLGVRQSFGNCPQYIQARAVEPRQGPDGVPAAQQLSGVDSRARAMIAAADTFFVASCSGAGDREAGGMDMSHRGGRPGFVRVDGDVLTIPDFRGNNYFNTLGNLLLEPRVGLLFVDFAEGCLLHLQGWAEVDWDGGAASGFAGAERVWRVHVTAGWHRADALGLRWTFRDYAPTTERTGGWPASDAC